MTPLGLQSDHFLKTFPRLAGVLAAALVFGVVLYLDHAKNLQHRESVKAITLQQLATLRANAEIAINKRVHLVRGIRAHVSSHPEITQAEFALFAEALMQESDGIRSFSLVKDNVISDVYPWEGNEGAIGLDLMKHPKQREAALLAIQTGQLWLDGPIQLVQGGEAFITRAPVYRLKNRDDSSNGYWGMVSILIDKDILLSDILRNQPPELEIAIRGHDRNYQAEAQYFHGDPAIESQTPLELEISLPTGAWHLVGIPKGGWPKRAPTSRLLLAVGASISCVVGFLIFAILRSNSELTRTRRVALSASSAKSEFLANMSHEIRTPMSAILGYVDILKNDEEYITSSEKRNEGLTTIQKNGEHLLSIINDILDLSKIEAGKMTVESIPCSPSELLDEIASLMRVRVEAKALKLQIESDGLIPESIHSDPTRLRQILVNLVGNSIKFTEDGTIHVRVRYRSDSPDRLEFEVSDRGIGMTPQQQKELFRPFVQANTSTTRHYGGTGLGLSICQRLTKILGGGIEVAQSELGEGTTLRFWIHPGPMDSAKFISLKASGSKPVRSATGNEVSSDLPSLSGCRILLAEDSPYNQRLFSFLLTKAGAETTIVENGQLAVEAALAASQTPTPFHLILMDMQMPVWDGYKATAQLRSQGYQGPIVALTAHSMSSDRDKCLQAGCDDFLNKPVDRQELLYTVRQFTPEHSPAPAELVGQET